mgnify:CR=1 FL=1
MIMNEIRELTKEYRVNVYDTGPDGKLAIYTMFDYLQDIASDHAEMLGYGRDDLMQQNNFWVLSRIYAEIYSLPEWNDLIKVRTWPRGTDRLFAIRDYEIMEPGGQKIAAATSSWLIVDKTTKKIRRPDNTLSYMNTDFLKDRSLPENAGKIEPAAPEGMIMSRFNVRVSDLDINLHTNNARYLKWAIDTYNLGFILNNDPFSVEINYLAESHFNDEINIKVSVENNGAMFFNHSIFGSQGNNELCRIKIGWKDNSTEK